MLQNQAHSLTAITTNMLDVNYGHSSWKKDEGEDEFV